MENMQFGSILLFNFSDKLLCLDEFIIHKIIIIMTHYNL